MPYINRNESNEIISVFGGPQFEGQEWIADDSPELDAHIPPKTRGQRIDDALSGTEVRGKLARVLEDIADNIANGTPLPVVVVDWLNDRRTRRDGVE